MIRAEEVTRLLLCDGPESHGGVGHIVPSREDVASVEAFDLEAMRERRGAVTGRRPRYCTTCARKARARGALGHRVS